MPIIRKVIGVGRSKAVTLPKTWLDFFEGEIGEKIESVTIEVDRKLIIEPYVKKDSEEREISSNE